MSICQFENRLTQQALSLTGLVKRVTANQPSELGDAFAQIEQAKQNGHWVALLLDYELGEWLEPALMPSSSIADQPPRLTALVYEHMTSGTPWTAMQPSHSSEASAGVVSVTPRITRNEYINNIEQIRHWISQGEVYQVNSTFPLDVVTTGTPQSLYRQLANRHPSSYSAYIEDTQRTVLSFSPELFLRKSGDTLTTRPMKGTAPRSVDPVRDHEIGRALLSSEKDRAENLMIVDLLRNDLGRVAAPGSVTVSDLFTLEQYPSVWTMTSTVEAQLRPNVTFGDILRALFPCGSVTGAPKIAAMQRIRQTESHPRGLYCGSIGWMSPTGDFELNVAIRTLVIDASGRGRYHVGSGIVYDSSPAKEWEECQWKARILGNNQWTFPQTPR